MKKGGLGKGLDAIFAENNTETGNQVVTLRIADIEPNREQPRKDFDENSMAELADSIARHGVLQPLLVRPIFGGGYQIVAGERRWRAARMAGLAEVPVVVREMNDSEVMELALIENLQREDLSPLEEAQGYQTLMQRYDLTQEDISKTVGKSRPSIANALRLLNLPEIIQKMLEEGKISAGHARTLLSFPNEELMIQAAKLVAEQGISVRELEKLSKKASAQQTQKSSQRNRNPYFSEVEIAMHQYLGRRVHVVGSAKKGSLQIEFYGEEDLKNLIAGIQFTDKKDGV